MKTRWTCASLLMIATSPAWAAPPAAKTSHFDQSHSHPLNQVNDTMVCRASLAQGNVQAGPIAFSQPRAFSVLVSASILGVIDVRLDTFDAQGRRITDHVQVGAKIRSSSAGGEEKVIFTATNADPRNRGSANLELSRKTTINGPWVGTLTVSDPSLFSGVNTVPMLQGACDARPEPQD